MNIETKTEGDVTVCHFMGNLDTNTSVEAKAKLDEVLEGGATKLLVDFTKLDYVSSAGLRILLATAKALRGSGELRLCGLNETVQEIFDISGFSSLLKVSKTSEEALGEF
jgi:anti-anti-sigma factor